MGNDVVGWYVDLSFCMPVFYCQQLPMLVSEISNVFSLFSFFKASLVDGVNSLTI